jgi:hypothetical protein
MATNNNGNYIDSSGNVGVDYVWGNFPMQPNDERNSADFNAPVTTNVVAANATGNNGWSGYNVYPAVRLNPGTISKSFNNVGGTTLVGNNHAADEAAYAGFPTFIPAGAKYLVTSAYGDGTTVTYTAQNRLNIGDVVTITGLGTGAFNLTSATVASADATKFTVTNAATGTAVYGAVGYATNVTNAAAEDGAYISGVAYLQVPNVLGQTTAIALDILGDTGYEAANITTATAATNTAKSITQINVTATTVATVTATGAGAAYPVGTKVAIGAGTGIPAALVGSWTVTGTATNTITISGSGWTVANTGAITPAASLTGLTGTINAQSTAAGAASVLTTATITVTPWA